MSDEIRTEIDDREVRAAFDKLRLRMSPGGMRRGLAEIGRYGKSSTQMRFRNQVDPDGNRWPPSARAKRDNGQTLRDTGRLRNSLAWNVDDRGVEWGTNVKYAGVHQNGYSNPRQLVRAHQRLLTMAWGNKVKKPRKINVRSFNRNMKIPRRRFLGINATDRSVILQILADEIARPL